MAKTKCSQKKNVKCQKRRLHVCQNCCGKGKTRKKTKVRSGKGQPSTNPFSYFFRYVYNRMKAMEQPNDCKKENKSKVNVTDAMRQAGRCWRKLSEEQKEDFKGRHCPGFCGGKGGSPPGCGGSSSAPRFSFPWFGRGGPTSAPGFNTHDNQQPSYDFCSDLDADRSSPDECECSSMDLEEEINPYPDFQLHELDDPDIGHWGISRRFP